MQKNGEILLASEETRSNFQKTFLLLGLMIAFVFALSWILGELLGNAEAGLKIGFLVCLIVIPLEIMSARFAIISLTGCVPLDLSNPAEQRLLNILQGISISAGLKRTPDLFLIESGIPNAFASGWNEDSAIIGITTGLADMMDDQELEGVIAHEVSHIVHRDIMTCQMALALNTAILLLSIFIQWISFFCAERARETSTRIFFWLLFFFIYPVSAVSGLILCMAISRKREFAADALAVRLCSYNEGLARALEKIEKNCSRYNEKQIFELGGKEIGCLYFHFPIDSIFSTHPATNERIRRLRNMY